MLVYFRNVNVINELGIVLRAPKEGIEEVKAEFIRLRELYDDDWTKVNEGLKRLYASWPEGDERKMLARFSRVDEKGPYRDDGNISWPGGGGPRYEVLHPITKKACKIPSRGWVYPNIKRMEEEIANGRVVFGPDETTTPRIRTNLFEQDKKVMRSVMFSYAQTATQEFNKLFDNKRVFENPKAVSDIKKIVEYYTSDDKDSVILDFFSGSATTAHAVMQLNAEDGGHRKFIMVQLPEPTDEKSEAYKAGYKNICEIGKERIRRAGRTIYNKYLEEGQELRNADQAFWVESDEYKNACKQIADSIDIGFRVLKLDSSNMKDVYYTPEKTTRNLFESLVDNIKEDRTPEDLLFQVLLELGIPLSAKIEEITVAGKRVFSVNDDYLLACFDKNLTADVIDAIASRHPYYVVTRDASMANDSVKTSFEQILLSHGIKSDEWKVL